MLSLALCCLGYYLAAALAIVLGYHRILAHRALRLPLWLERSLVTLGLPAGTPIQWAGNHRHHHAHTDQCGDPHSPHLDGFWYAHVGWYIQSHDWRLCLPYACAGPLRMIIDGWRRPRTNQQHAHRAADIAADPYYSFLSRPRVFLLSGLLHAVIPGVTAFGIWGWQGLGAFWVTLILVYNIGDAIDSLGHIVGSRPFRNNGQARNNLVLALLTFGDGWHASHHAFPGSARHGLLPWQIDTMWLLISLLEMLGIARDVTRTPSREIMRKLNIH